MTDVWHSIAVKGRYINILKGKFVLGNLWLNHRLIRDRFVKGFCFMSGFISHVAAGAYCHADNMWNCV